ncbi:ATP-binding protein involved in chromosome partitioning [Leucobacter exalbidus]|uniref:Iron-sulfur cluster carrier protein n=1 Tax=Leucobacter exalbidus TaxID=662960 RepID=A0A940T742_9MICO|nr:P-loop NTPase [Leucobacter exalbidus]MBP1327631.1 ATP-binding protein involved in chromosome partitioning [Leucobacter exalbidus]
MSLPIETAILESLSRVQDPEILRPITELGMVGQVAVDEAGHASVGISLTIAGCPAARKIEADVTAAVAGTPGVTGTSIDVGVMTSEERAAFVKLVRGDREARPQQFGPDSLTRVIAVTSGKGGVGKSSLTAGLAVSLAAQGLSVGLVDADIFGFSIPGIMGLSRDGQVAQPSRVDDMIVPPVAHGVKVISIGMFLGDADPRKTAVSWRGPMLHRTIEQFLRDVWFGDLDVLLLDLPPGTGDVAISVGQLLPQAEVLVITTPQEAAADVAVRSALVARQTGQRVIGVIENMAGLVQPDGSIIDVFGSGGGQLVVERLKDTEHPDVPLLGSVPLSPAFREAGDAGDPAVLTLPDDPAARTVRELAGALAVSGRGLAGRKLGLSVR